jgi:hypothetical protein
MYKTLFGPLCKNHWTCTRLPDVCWSDWELVEVSKHLHHFYTERGICQLTDHAYDMSMSISCNYSVTMLLNKLFRCIVRHGMPVRAIWTTMGILCKLHTVVKCVLYGALDPLVSWPWCNHSQWFNHYRTNVISWCGPLEVELDHATNVTYNMLCNSWGTGIVL